MDNGQWTMDNGQWTMDNGQWTMDNNQLYPKQSIILKIIIITKLHHTPDYRLQTTDYRLQTPDSSNL